MSVALANTGLRQAAGAALPGAAVLRPWRGPSPAPAQALGVLHYPQDAGLALLHGPATDAWCSPAPIQAQGQCGALRWRHDGHWLWGELTMAEHGDLAGCVQQAYADVFATLRSTGFAHPQRLWNYLPDIHGDDAGLERYRRFNAARQQAFLSASMPAFEGAPAACCLGSPAGQPLRLRLLAGRHAPLPLENPRQVSAYHYPSAYGPRSPTFSRAALLAAGEGQLLLLVSGTASIVGHESRHAGQLLAQLDETLANLQAVIASAHQRGSARFALPQLALTAYVRHAGDAEPLRQALAQRLGADSPALQQLVLLQAEVCRSDLLLEIEAHGQAPGEVAA